jgi:hypothetical protein
LLGQIIDYGYRFYNKPHPLYPPLLRKERGRKKKEGLTPLLDALQPAFWHSIILK